VLDDIASVTLQSAIGGLAQRERVTANNIANIETPDFTASQVSFEADLADAVASGNPAAASFNVDPTTDAAGANGNNVSLDNELVTATKTTLQEQLLTGALTSKYGLVSTVLKG
jgi:flagellar basal-body rod protein FlgB